nr:ribonuclease H-like domain, reverse transcriptase, RNA-dependent DNA polymerase [Tanacetum cinerariifolium]
MVSFIKLLILKKGEYILWTMKMEQYLAYTDYALWKVILNGNSAVQMTKDEASNKVEVPPVTAQQILARTRERKAKITLLMAILDEHLSRFHGIKDAKTLWAAVKTRFGGNAESKKMQKNAIVLRHKVPHHMLMNSCSYFFANQSSSPQLNNEDLEQINQYNLEEMELKWQVAMLSMRVKRFYKKTGRKLEFNGKERVGFDKIKVECFNCHRRGHFARDFRSARNSENMSRDAGNAGSTISSTNSEVQSCSKQCVQSYEQLKILFDEQRKKLRKANLEIISYQYGLESIKGQLRVHQQNEVIYEEKIRVLEYAVKDKSNLLKYTQKQLDEALKEIEYLKAKLKKFKTSSKNITKLLDSQISAKVKTGLGYDSQFNEKEVLVVKEEEVTETVFDNRSSDEENSLANDRFKKGEGYHAVPPPLTGNYMPPKSDLSFPRLDDSIYTFKISKIVTSVTKDEKDAPKTSTACIDKPKEDSMSHLIKDCTFHEDRMAKKSVLPNNVGKGTGHKESIPVWNNVQRTNQQTKFAPTAVFTRNSIEKVNTARSKAVNAVKGNGIIVVKTLAGCVWRPRVNDIYQIFKDNKWICTPVDYVDPQGRLKSVEVKLSAKSSDYKAADDKSKGDIGSKTVEEPVNKEDQAYKDELDRLISQEKEVSDAANALRKGSEQGCMDQKGATNAGRTNAVNTIIQTVGAEADFNNIDSSTFIFRYLKGQPKLGLWYLRDSLFDLESYSNSDYARANLDRKPTTGGCQFLGRRLISWQCKKQTIVATSTTEAEYVATANCCG